MIENLTIFLNTHSRCSDCWPAFFGQLKKHWPDHPPVVAAVDYDVYNPLIITADVTDEHRRQSAELIELTSRRKLAFGDSRARVHVYDRDAAFGQQYLQGLSHVTTDYVLPVLEDYILMGDVDTAAMEEAVKLAGEEGKPVQLTNCVGRPIDDTTSGRFSGFIARFTMQPTIWPTSELLSRCVRFRSMPNPWEWELGYPGMPNTHSVYAPIEHGPKRGRVHHDSLIFPFIATALDKGKWSTTVYPELRPLLEQYGIDPSVRGEI